MPGSFIRKYGTELVASAAGASKLRLAIRKAGSPDFAATADWTPATGDVKVSKDGGAQANIATLPAYSEGSWEITLSATEMQARQIRIAIVDSATKAVDDDEVTVETFGHASAMFPSNYEAGPAIDASGRVQADVALWGGEANPTIPTAAQNATATRTEVGKLIGASGVYTHVGSAGTSASVVLSQEPEFDVTGGIVVADDGGSWGIILSIDGVNLTADRLLTLGTGSTIVILPNGGTAPPTAAAVADAVWDEVLSGHTTTGTAGKVLGFVDDVKKIVQAQP